MTRIKAELLGSKIQTRDFLAEIKENHLAKNQEIIGAHKYAKESFESIFIDIGREFIGFAIGLAISPSFHYLKDRINNINQDKNFLSYYQNQWTINEFLKPIIAQNLAAAAMTLNHQGLVNKLAIMKLSGDLIISYDKSYSYSTHASEVAKHVAINSVAYVLNLYTIPSIYAVNPIAAVATSYLMSDVVDLGISIIYQGYNHLTGLVTETSE